MKITIESTEHVVDVDGVTCRYWKGVTADGVPCHVLVHRVAFHNAEGYRAASQELFEMPPVTSAEVYDAIQRER